jgi:diadenosine tetraphosphate (Ap4A) HIT family hydrolase/predicted house-cleaning noncanonical NTP pyrophosphatase (MazG superfamily)
MSKRQFHKGKLVRDRISKIMTDQGIVIHERILDKKEFVISLKEKLLEEALEVQNAQNEKELIEELADVFEVLHTLIRSQDLTMEQIENARLQKRDLKGGFEAKVYIDSIEMEESNPFIHRYCHSNLIPNCLFCKMGQESQVLAHFKHCYVIKDQYPVSPGHLLIIPYEHTLNWFTAKREVKLDIIHAISLMKHMLDSEYQPEGYNIGMNCGEVAGQSVMHLHVHLIPRYKGDMENPRGGVRGVIPSKQSY